MGAKTSWCGCGSGYWLVFRWMGEAFFSKSPAGVCAGRYSRSVYCWIGLCDHNRACRNCSGWRTRCEYYFVRGGARSGRSGHRTSIPGHFFELRGGGDASDLPALQRWGCSRGRR